MLHRWISSETFQIVIHVSPHEFTAMCAKENKVVGAFFACGASGAWENGVCRKTLWGQNLQKETAGFP